MDTSRMTGVLSAAAMMLSSFLLVESGAVRAAQRGPQPPQGPGGPAPSNASHQADAPFDLTGYWVSIISDEWRYRMLTPPKGNVDYVPVNAEGRRHADQWDPARDEAAGEACRGYGAGGIMRLPARLHVTWQDPKTLRIEVDTGTQTRTFHFGETQPPAGQQPSWQGYSSAQWEFSGLGRGRGAQPRQGQLKVVTTNLRSGYLRKNGVPYGERAVLTEYFVVLTDDDGLQYLAVTTKLDDPQYLVQPWVRTSQFRKQPDASGWSPSPCSAK